MWTVSGLMKRKHTHTNTHLAHPSVHNAKHGKGLAEKASTAPKTKPYKTFQGLKLYSMYQRVCPVGVDGYWVNGKGCCKSNRKNGNQSLYDKEAFLWGKMRECAWMFSFSLWEDWSICVGTGLVWSYLWVTQGQDCLGMSQMSSVICIWRSAGTGPHHESSSRLCERWLLTSSGSQPSLPAAQSQCGAPSPLQ